MNKALPPLTKLKNLPPPQEGGLCINIYELRNWTLYPLPITRTLAHTTQLLFGKPPILGDIVLPPRAGRREGRSMGVLEERHPGQFAFSSANRSSSEAQHRTAALSDDLCRRWSERHWSRLEDLPWGHPPFWEPVGRSSTRPLVDGPLQDWGESPKCVSWLLS